MHNGKILIPKKEYTSLSFKWSLSDVFDFHLRKAICNNVDIFSYAFKESDNYYEMLWCDELFYNKLNDKYINELIKDGYIILKK